MNHFTSMWNMLQEANVPHTVDSDLQHYRDTFSKDVTYTLTVQNWPHKKMPQTYIDARKAKGLPANPDAMIDAIGYGGFMSVWLFDNDGKLIGVGHYEE